MHGTGQGFASAEKQGSVATLAQPPQRAAVQAFKFWSIGERRDQQGRVGWQAMFDLMIKPRACKITSNKEETVGERESIAGKMQRPVKRSSNAKINKKQGLCIWHMGLSAADHCIPAPSRTNRLCKT